MSRGRETDRSAQAGEPPVPASSATGFALAVIAACVGLVAVDVALVLRNRSLRERVAALTSAAHVADRPLRPLVEGERLPSLAAWDAAGEPVDLARSPAHTATLLYVSSEACTLCEGVRSLWAELAERARGSHVRVLELVVDARAAGLDARAAPYPRVRAGDDVGSLTSRVPGLPAALFVDEHGVVARAFYGERLAGLPEALEAALLG